MKEYVYSPHYDFYIDYVKRPEGYEMKTLHFHKKYEIYYQEKGARRYFAGSNAYIVNEGSLVLLPSDSVHKTGSIENMAHARYVLNFTREYLSELSAAFPDVDFFSCFEAKIHVLQPSPPLQRMVVQSLSRMWKAHRETGAKETAARKMELAQLLLLLCGAVDEVKEKPPYKGSMTNELVENIQIYIARNYVSHLTLAEISKHFFIHKDYLSRLFKKTTGLSVVEYINSVRLTAARDSLESTGKSITRIGEEVGFGTTTHFSRLFKEGTGLSPQQYRKLYKTEERLRNEQS